MLTEVLMSITPPEKQSRKPEIYASSLFPCAYRLYLAEQGKIWDDEVTPQQYYNMEDGNEQEEQSVQRLAKVGINIEDRQKRVYLGKSQVRGKVDGTYTVNGIKRVWEHKAFNTRNFEELSFWGIEAFPHYKCQLHSYMVGLELEEGCFFVKHKDTNTYWDRVYKRDDNFILPVLEWADRIRLDKWKPEPVESKYCERCGVNCFGTKLNMSWIETSGEIQKADLWIQGDKYEKVGKAMKEEARTYFLEQIGDKELLVVEDKLEVKKIIQHRFDISRQKVLEEFGAEGLLKVGEQKDIVQYRFKGLEGYNG